MADPKPVPKYKREATADVVVKDFVSDVHEGPVPPEPPGEASGEEIGITAPS